MSFGIFRSQWPRRCLDHVHVDMPARQAFMKTLNRFYGAGLEPDSWFSRGSTKPNLRTLALCHRSGASLDGAFCNTLRKEPVSSFPSKPPSKSWKQKRGRLVVSPKPPNESWRSMVSPKPPNKSWKVKCVLIFAILYGIFIGVCAKST